MPESTQIKIRKMGKIQREIRGTSFEPELQRAQNNDRTKLVLGSNFWN